MNKKKYEILGTIFGVIAAIVIALAIHGISWIVTCGIIKLITLCFGLEFSWEIATGIWLITVLLRSIFKSHVNVKK